MSTQPTDPIVTDRSTGDTAALVPTVAAGIDGLAACHQPADHVTADHVTAAEIAEFLRHLARFRSPATHADPDDHAALLARKAELLARIADQHAHAVATGAPATAAPTTPTAPEGRTP